MRPGSDHDNDRLDRAIDDVARRMTQGAPAVDLKARVLARIEASDASSWPRRLAWLGVPIAAAAAIFLVVFLWPHRDANRVVENAIHQPPVAGTPDRPLPPAPPRDTMEAMAQAEASPARIAAARAGIASPPLPFRTPSDVETMAPPPLEVPSIAVPSLPIADTALPSIAVEPLETITPIALAPIGGGDRQ